jgi:predicted phosphodiesterase
MMTQGRRKALLWLASSIIFLLLAGLTLLMVKSYRYDQHIPSEHLIGNKTSSVRALEEKGLPFSFLVIGDTHLSSRANALIEKALKTGPSSFMVILGDFVTKPDIRYHRHFLAEMASEVKPPFPVFLVPGNHDIDYTSSKTGKEGHRVTPEVYESLYGPKNFNFTFNDCLFIVFGLDSKNQMSYLSYLREVLSKEGKGKRYIFLFEHHPPRVVGKAGSFSLPNEEEFFSLLETYKVTTCFFGDYHAYWRGERRGTNLIVSGGGGGRLKNWQPEWGKFHHIMRITVGEDMTSEEMIILKGVVFPWSELRRNVYVCLFPVLKDRYWIVYSGAVVFFSLGIFSVVCFVLSLRKKR